MCHTNVVMNMLILLFNECFAFTMVVKLAA